MKIGVSSYSFQQYINAGKLDFLSVIDKAVELGFEAIEYIGLPGDTQEEKIALAEKIKEKAKNAGIEISAYVVGANLYKTGDELEKEISAVCRELDIAKVLGVKLFRHDVIYMLPTGVCFDRVLEEVVPTMRKIADYGEKLGIKTMIENHGKAFQDADRVERVFSAVNHKNFALLVDMGNFMCADEIPVKSVSRVANLAAHVHLKDFDVKGFSEEKDGSYFATRGCNYLSGTYVGGGKANAAQCIAVLKAAGYDGYLDIEFEGPKDCIEELKKGIAFVKACL